MQISSRFTIAIHIFTCVEYFKDREKITSDFLSGSINSNPVSIRNILSQLRKAGLITVARGTGGIKITRDLADILEIEASLLYDDFSRFLAVPYTEALKRVRMVLGLSLKALQSK